MAEIKITSTPANSRPQIRILDGGAQQSTTVKIVPAHGEKGDTGLQGIQGEKGDKGDTGDKGDKGDIGGVYEHNQSAVAAIWIINHNLGYNPNVTVLDSAGSVVEAELWYNNPNSLEVRFSFGMSGKAYLS